MQRDDRAAAVGYIVLTTEALKKATRLGREGGAESAIRGHLRDAAEYLERASVAVGWQVGLDFDETEGDASDPMIPDDAVACRFCACTNDMACEGGCRWLSRDGEPVDACDACARWADCHVCGESLSALVSRLGAGPGVCDDCRRSLPGPSEDTAAEPAPEGELATAGDAS